MWFMTYIDTDTETISEISSLASYNIYLAKCPFQQTKIVIKYARKYR